MAVGAAGRGHHRGGVSLLCLGHCQTGILLPLVVTVLYAFLSIRLEGSSILDFLRYAVCFLILKQQYYEWGESTVYKGLHRVTV